ncbi:hypothetical protein CH305_05690 [Rhodococcus sp. 15-649-2-2]|nr:hypothetical protein CH305_05690 [Rhodococcus sp. 15-649-2-2]
MLIFMKFCSSSWIGVSVMRLDLLDLRCAGRFGFAEPLCALNERRDTDPTAFPPTRSTLRRTSSTGTPLLSTSEGLGVYCRSHVD